MRDCSEIQAPVPWPEDLRLTDGDMRWTWMVVKLLLFYTHSVNQYYVRCVTKQACFCALTIQNRAKSSTMIVHLITQSWRNLSALCHTNTKQSPLPRRRAPSIIVSDDDRWRPIKSSKSRDAQERISNAHSQSCHWGLLNDNIWNKIPRQKGRSDQAGSESCSSMNLFTTKQTHLSA